MVLINKLNVIDPENTFIFKSTKQVILKFLKHVPQHFSF